MTTAFVVLTYNRSDALLAVLRGLAPQCGPGHVVVIADDGSRPEHVQALRAGLPHFACPVRHVWQADAGFTAARSRNLGAAQAHADYIVFMDGDCVPNPRFVEQHERLAGDVNKLTHLLHWPQAPFRVEPRFRWKGIRSCNFGVSWRDFEAVNGFDEVYSGWGHEDADLVLRLHHHGSRRKNGFLGTEVYHLWHEEHSRAGEAANRERVVARMKSGIIRAETGLAEALHTTETVVTELKR